MWSIHIKLKVKLKNLYQNIYTECVPWKRLFKVHLGLSVYFTPFLKGFNTSLFIWLFRGTIILIKYASKIFRLKVFLGATDNTDRWKPWLKCSWRCLKHSEFLSIPLSCSFHLILTLRIVSPLKSSPQEQKPLAKAQLKCCALSLLLKRDCILRIFQIMWNLTLPLIKFFNILIKRLLNFLFWGAKGNLISINFVSSNNNFGINSYSFSLLNLQKVSLMNLTG